MLSPNPKPPYYAVIFSSTLKDSLKGYAEMSMRMVELAQLQPGFIGFESAREHIGMTVSYWKDEASILNWKKNIEHLAAQRKGIDRWYSSYIVRICKVERSYEFGID